MPIDPKYVAQIADMVTDDPDVLKIESPQAPPPPTTDENQTPAVLTESLSHNCRNKVYRRGVAMKCGRACNNIYCESCEKALEEQKNRLLGISEAKKEPSNKPDDLEVEDSFEVHSGYTEENKKGPGEKVAPRHDLDSGPEGETGSKKSPYLK